MFVDVPLRDPMSGEGGQPWRLPVWLSATCRLCFGDEYVDGRQCGGAALGPAQPRRGPAMSASGPPAPNLLSSVRAAASAEEIFALLGVGYDPKVLNVARLHILKRMSAHLAEADLDGLPSDEVEVRLKEALARAYQDLASSSPLEQRVFKVLQDAVAPTPAQAEADVFIPLDSLRPD